MILISLILFMEFFGAIEMVRGPHHPNSAVVEKHVHYRPTKRHTHKITQDEQLMHDKEHIQEHIQDKAKVDLSKMTDEELEFYFFQVHDTDKNNKLDGLEIMQAILHTHHEDGLGDEEEGAGAGAGASLEEEQQLKKDQFQQELKYITELIDQVLSEDDVDKDGFISYPEYVAGKQNRPKFEGLPNLKKAN